MNLSASYAWCAALTRKTAGNFIYSFQVLPRIQRQAMNALYAFMRITDDLSDDVGEVTGKRLALSLWKEQLRAALHGEYSHPVHPALHQTVTRFRIPAAYLEEVIEGVQKDLDPVRIRTFAELYRYCYQVASVVGLSCIHIWDFREERAKEYAEEAGIALQLTNILRDLGEDLDRGRVYLPEEDWKRFDCPPEQWRQQVESDSFRELMRFQAMRAKDYYDRGSRLSPLLEPPGRAVFRVMLDIYRGLLDAIETRQFDVFRERVRLTQWKKLSLLVAAFPIRWGWI